MDGKSDLNHRFIAKIRDLKANNPGYFNNPQWPYLLAQEVNNSLSQAADMPVIPGMDAAMAGTSPAGASAPANTLAGIRLLAYGKMVKFLWKLKPMGLLP